VHLGLFDISEISLSNFSEIKESKVQLLLLKYILLKIIVFDAIEILKSNSELFYIF